MDTITYVGLHVHKPPGGAATRIAQAGAAPRRAAGDSVIIPSTRLSPASRLPAPGRCPEVRADHLGRASAVSVCGDPGGGTSRSLSLRHRKSPFQDCVHTISVG
jgi:hypothetical protein